MHFYPLHIDGRSESVAKHDRETCNTKEQKRNFSGWVKKRFIRFIHSVVLMGLRRAGPENYNFLLVKHQILSFGWLGYMLIFAAMAISLHRRKARRLIRRN